VPAPGLNDQELHYNQFICCENLNEPAWFLCCIQVYWMVFPWLYRRISTCSTARVIGCFACCWLLTLFWPILLTISGIQTYDKWGMRMPTVQAYHPISHIHKFVFGMCWGRLFVDFYATVDPDKPDDGRLYISETKIKSVAETKLFAPIGWCILLFMALHTKFDAFKFPLLGWSLDCKDFLLLPAFGLVIFGCAFRVDPISQFFAYFRCFATHNFSYEIYILQGCVWTTLQTILSHFNVIKLQSWTYLPVLCVVAFLVNRYITKPIAMLR